MIYTSAVYANAEHTQVTGTDVLGNTETVASDYTVFRQPADGPFGFVANGGAIGPYVAPPAAEAPLGLVQTACARLSVVDWDVTGVERSTGIAGAFVADTDTAWVFFETEQPDTNYILMPPDDFVKFTDHVEVTRPGLSDLSFLVFRVQ